MGAFQTWQEASSEGAASCCPSRLALGSGGWGGQGLGQVGTGVRHRDTLVTFT